MKLLRKILFPFAILYGCITGFRNFLYDFGILKSHVFDVPVIAVGNLSVGGTGKTPQIEYLIRLLSPTYKVATLSRGYKRKSKGFVLADATSNAEILGDEPFQYYQKFPNIQVAVDANRRNGIEELLSQDQKPQVILLDDAYQHRKVKAGFYILLTSYGDLFSDDFMLPTGNLRERRNGAKRADILIVTKCPPNLSAEAQNEIRLKLKISDNQQLFFSFINYDNYVFSSGNKLEVSKIHDQPKLLLAGIAKPESFFAYLHSENDIVLRFPDHHHFSSDDIETIKNNADDDLIITTEKDFVRLNDHLKSDKLFYLPIKSDFISGSENFDKTITNYVGKSTGNHQSY